MRKVVGLQTQPAHQCASFTADDASTFSRADIACLSHSNVLDELAVAGRTAAVDWNSVTDRALMGQTFPSSSFAVRCRPSRRPNNVILTAR